MNTEQIYINFKKDIKEAVQATKIRVIGGHRGYRPETLFGIESSEDKLYSEVTREVERCACREVDKLLYNLCNAYGYSATMPDTPENYDMTIEKGDAIYFVELKAAPSMMRNPRGYDSALTYVFLLKPTKENYDLLDRKISVEQINGAYLFTDFLKLIFGKEEVKKFKKAMTHFADEMKDVIGYQITRICNDRNLAELKQQLQTEILGFDYDSIRSANDAGKAYAGVLSNINYSRIKQRFQDTYSLLLGNNDFAVSFLTSEWLYRNFVSVPSIDNTYIVEGYLKSIEQLLWDIISLVGQGRPIGKEAKTIGNNESSCDTTLGSLRYFLKDGSNADLYNSAFGTSTSYVLSYIEKQLKEWTDNSRNGYFHKHNLSGKSVIEEIRKQTYYLYFLLLGSLALTDDQITTLME